MDDVWFADGASRADWEACLKALSLEGKDRPPLLAVATAEAEPRLLLASRALFTLFGVHSGQALGERLLLGRDPGARRLGVLCRNLALDGAPRLERLRFFVGPGSEIITFLCRRLPVAGGSRFIAAALGVRPGLMASSPEAVVTPAQAAPPAPPPQAPVTTTAVAPAPEPVPAPQAPRAMDAQAIQASLRERWPASRTVRFTWQSDADLVCTAVTPALADAVGAANGELVGRDLLALAPQIDPSGKLAAALARKETWSGLDVDWPIDETPAAVAIGLGAIPAFDRDRTFEGYRGYGVIHLDRLVAGPPRRLASAPAAAPPQDEPPIAPDAGTPEAGPDAARAPAPEAANVVRFPGAAKGLSPEDQQAFAELGAELREETGLDAHGLHPPEPEPAPVAPAPEPAAPATEAPAPDARRAEEIARHGLAILDKLAVGILVSRNNVPIFANRHLLDTLGFADEDALHEAGGMAHLFGGQPGNTTGAEAVGVRGRDGRIVTANARMQTIDWDDLPATLLTLHPATPPSAAEPAPTALAPAPEPVPPEASASGDAAEARELRAILETATDGVAVIDADCNILSLNRSGEALFGCDRGEVVGKPFLSLFAPHNQGLASDYVEGLKSNATKSLLNDGREFLANTRRGDTIPVFMTLGRVSSPDMPGGARFCALFRDLTHWKKVERELETARQDAERANALKTDFLAKVSHEVRTPLNAIIGFAEVMMEERFGPIGTERYKDYLRDIHGSGTHVMSLVNDLLDLSKIEAGKMELAIDAIDANKVIGECVAFMQPQASRERVIMRLSLAPRLPQIKADARSLRQIVLNLLSNAVKFNEPGGQVIVATATTESGHVLIRIRDTGPGMSDTDIAAALEPFRQLSTARPNPGGTGLGLPLTKALVEANQASFAIRSKVDQGTLVEVSFPPARVLAG